MSGEGVLSNSARPQPADPQLAGAIAHIVSMTLRRHDPSCDFEDPQLDLVTDLKADELDLVAIAMDMEMVFGIDLPDAALAHIATIGDLHRFVTDHLPLAEARQRSGAWLHRHGLAA